VGAYFNLSSKTNKRITFFQNADGLPLTLARAEHVPIAHSREVRPLGFPEREVEDVFQCRLQLRQPRLSLIDNTED